MSSQRSCGSKVVGSSSSGWVSNITAGRWTAYRNLCGCENGCTRASCRQILTFFFNYFFTLVRVCLLLFWIVRGVRTCLGVYFNESWGKLLFFFFFPLWSRAPDLVLPCVQSRWRLSILNNGLVLVCMYSMHRWLSGGLYLWLIFQCMCVWVSLYGWIIPSIMGPVC